MRIKTYSAPSVRDAMIKVREDLGADAVIVSTRDAINGSDAMVTAALEGEFDNRLTATAPLPDGVADPFETLDDVLDYHRVPPQVADPLRAAAGVIDTDDSLALLAAALDMRFRFESMDLATCGGTVMLVGPPGAGKTVACAKIAAQRVLAGTGVSLVSTDVDRPGAIERLRALAGKLETPLVTAGTTEELRRIVETSGETLVVVDTPGTNTLSADELQSLTAQTELGNLRTLLVLPAGNDPFDDAAAARAFGACGATGIIATRLDSASRFGGLVAGAFAARLPFVAASILPAIGEGLVRLNPMSLARLLIAHPLGEPNPFADAVSQT